MYHFARRPRWVLVHLLIVGIAVTCVLLGLWQLRRLDDRRAHNARVRAGQEAEPVEIEHLGPDEPLDWRRVEATGAYDPDEEVLLLGRSRDGAPGSHVLTPLVTEDGSAVLVDRGWVPMEMDETPVRDAPPPRGEVRVTGTFLPNQPASTFGPRNPSEGETDRLSRLDVSRLEAQLPYPLLGNALLLQDQDPSGRDLPLPGDLPELSEGPHLTYAIQWFSFVPIGLIGYGAILRRESRKREAQSPSGAPSQQGSM